MQIPRDRCDPIYEVLSKTSDIKADFVGFRERGLRAVRIFSNEEVATEPRRYRFLGVSLNLCNGFAIKIRQQSHKSRVIAI
ncbi:hypothetical protein MTP99_002158 [Tenebrio molitor]|nr:hypothetical protein MTP99_002158 [Tenebrio molitor]